MKIDVKSIVEKRKETVKDTNKYLDKKLLIVQVGDDSASNIYIKGKMKDCAEVGIKTVLIKYPDGINADDIAEDLSNICKKFDGVILQEPANITATLFYKHPKDYILKNIITKQRDVDGFLPDSNFEPCTPLGIMNLLKEILGTGNLRGWNVTVVGRGKLVGAPLIPMLNDAGATVISCNSATTDLTKMTKLGDIVISAVGKKNLINRDMLKNGAIVIDAGIVVDEDGKLSGDCNKNLYDDPNILITTVPGGVGLMTRVTLLENVIRS